MTASLVSQIRTWRTRSTVTIEQHYARAEGVLLTTVILDADRVLHHNKQQLAELNE
jgi:hypothetical protein